MNIFGPKTRQFITQGFTAAIGTLCSMTATQAMPNGVYSYDALLASTCLKILGFVVLAWAFFSNKFLKYDNDVIMGVLNFHDDAYCKAYAKKMGFEAKAKQLQDDPSKIELYDATEFLKQMGVSEKP
ncbi:hypothetical protein [Aeromonas caviae]